MFNGLTLDQIVEHRDKLFMRIPVLIDPTGRENECYANCLARVERDGGEVLVGWRKSVATVGAEYIATLDHHAVWQNPVGEITDISARVRRFRGELWKVTDTFVEFMVDRDATFDDANKARPSRIIPIAPDPKGYLKKACGFAERAREAEAAGNMESMRYNDSRAEALLNKHHDTLRGC